MAIKLDTSSLKNQNNILKPDEAEGRGIKLRKVETVQHLRVLDIPFLMQAW